MLGNQYYQLGEPPILGDGKGINTGIQTLIVRQTSSTIRGRSSDRRLRRPRDRGQQLEGLPRRSVDRRLLRRSAGHHIRSGQEAVRRRRSRAVLPDRCAVDRAVPGGCRRPLRLRGDQDPCRPQALCRRSLQRDRHRAERARRRRTQTDRLLETVARRNHDDDTGDHSTGRPPAIRLDRSRDPAESTSPRHCATTMSPRSAPRC